MNSTKKISKNDFIFVKVVGRGSFGKVYLVKKKDKPEIPLALKVLQKEVIAKRNLLIKTQGKLIKSLTIVIFSWKGYIGEDQQSVYRETVLRILDRF